MPVSENHALAPSSAATSRRGRAAPEARRTIRGDFVGCRRRASYPEFAERAFARATGSEPIGGNGVRLLLDAQENYPAWLAAIRDARQSILFESYIFADDAVGREFAEALAAKARAGVAVRVVCDWLGTRRVGVAAYDAHRSGSGVSRIQPAALRQSARLARAQPSQDDHDRRARRLRIRSLRQLEMERGPCARNGAVA